MVRDCPKAADYIRQNKCIRVEGRIMLPNGGYIPRGLNGQDISQRIDEAIAADTNRSRATGSNAIIIPGASSNMFEVFPPEEYQVEIEDDELESEMQVLLARVNELTAKKKRTEFEGVFPPQGNQRAGPSRQKAAHPKQVPPAVTGTQPAPTVTTPSITVQPPVPSSSAPHYSTPESAKQPAAPQYHYESPSDSPALAKAAIARVLDTSVTISQRELLALSPDFRKHLKDITTARRVISTTVFSEVDADVLFAGKDGSDSKPLIVAGGLESLRVVNGTIADKHEVECVLDSGSQIVVMRRDVWIKTGLPIRADRALMMESADKGKSLTLGQIENVKVTIGSVEAYLQIQVVEDAPFKVLIGRPFFSFTSCITYDYNDGSQEILLHDPNRNISSRLPTRPRERQTKPSNPPEGSGFP